MIHTGHRNMLSFIVKPLFIALLLFGIFSIVWLRSGVVTMEYSIGDLEKKKMLVLKDRKMLMAERASLLSIQKVENTAMGNFGLVFPDRAKVIHVKKQRGPVPYMASASGRIRETLDARQTSYVLPFTFNGQ